MKQKKMLLIINSHLVNVIEGRPRRELRPARAMGAGRRRRRGRAPDDTARAPSIPILYLLPILDTTTTTSEYLSLHGHSGTM